MPSANLRPSIVRGGPVHDLLSRLGLTAADGLPAVKFAIGLALFAWVLPVFLALLQSALDVSYSGQAILIDGTVYTRFLIAIAILLLTERYADGRFELLLQQFRSTELVPEHSEIQFKSIIGDADRWSSSRLLELSLLALAIFLPGLVTDYTLNLAGTSWEGAVVNGDIHYSWAGAASRFFSTPLFHFLMLRWVWRFLVWTLMLYRVSRLPLQLTPLHPDRCAGVGFLALYPSVFSGFVFALSCVVAASLIKELSLIELEANTIWMWLAAWITLILILFLGPLFVFSRPIFLAREQALLDYGRLANQHHLAFQKKWLTSQRRGNELLGSADASSTADINGGLEVIYRINTFPVDRTAVTQLLAATCLPLLAVVLKMIPLTELIEKLILAIV